MHKNNNLSEDKNTKSVPPTIYSKEYYTTCCDGFDEFNRSQGDELPQRIITPLRLLNLQPNSVILDIGCGRGELVLNLAKQGHTAIGLDYAPHGVKIARDALVDQTLPTMKMGISQANAKTLAFASNSVDCVFMLDVVEHLYPDELQQAFRDIFRVLKPGGQLVIHTMPNTWYYAVGYPIYRLLQYLRGERLPRDPRDRWDFKEVHVNEQNIIRLKNALNSVGFSSNVWLTSIQNYNYEKNPVVRTGMKFLTTVPPFKLVFCNDIFAIATKKHRER